MLEIGEEIPFPEPGRSHLSPKLGDGFSRNRQQVEVLVSVELLVQAPYTSPSPGRWGSMNSERALLNDHARIGFPGHGGHDFGAVADASSRSSSTRLSVEEGV